MRKKDEVLKKTVSKIWMELLFSHKEMDYIVNNQRADKDIRERERAVPSERKLRETTNKSKNIMQVWQKMGWQERWSGEREKRV